jgi:hypothetical protein
LGWWDKKEKKKINYDMSNSGKWWKEKFEEMEADWLGVLTMTFEHQVIAARVLDMFKIVSKLYWELKISAKWGAIL